MSPAEISVNSDKFQVAGSISFPNSVRQIFPRDSHSHSCFTQWPWAAMRMNNKEKSRALTLIHFGNAYFCTFLWKTLAATRIVSSPQNNLDVQSDGDLTARSFLDTTITSTFDSVVVTAKGAKLEEKACKFASVCFVALRWWILYRWYTHTHTHSLSVCVCVCVFSVRFGSNMQYTFRLLIILRPYTQFTESLVLSLRFPLSPLLLFARCMFVHIRCSDSKCNQRYYSRCPVGG